MRDNILRLLNIRHEEVHLVRQLFFLQMFQGVGVAVFNAVTWVLFLKTFHAHGLPYAYLCTAVLLWLVGFVYNKFENKVAIKKFIPGVILCLALGVALCVIPFLFTHAEWLIFAMLCWYYAVYLVSALEFWGLAALLFDIRQSKRLFGLIGAGDIAAKLIGYSVVPLLAAVLSTEVMLIISSAIILCSLFFFQKLYRTGAVNITVMHDHQTHASHSVRDIVRGFFASRLIAVLGILSFTVTACVLLIGFSFYSEIKTEATTDAQLAAFIGVFFAIGRVAALLTRLVLTGRFASRLGLKGSLLVSPVIMLLILAAIFSMPLFSDHIKPLMYAFGAMMIVSEVVKYALQDPIFLTLMQPLSAHLRLKGHTIVKGVTDPFAVAFSGALLRGIMQLTRQSSLMMAGYLLLGLLILWIALVFVVDKEYHRVLLRALQKRYSVGHELDLNDERTRGVLIEKARNGERGEALYALSLAGKYPSEATVRIVGNGMGHSDVQVKRFALSMAERLRLSELIPQIDSCLNNPENAALTADAVRARCTISPGGVDEYDAYLEDSDTSVVKAAAAGMLQSGGIAAMVTAGQKLLGLIESGSPEDRIAAADIIGELGIESFYKPLVGLMSDPDDRVVRAATAAAGNVRNPKLVPHILNIFAAGKDGRVAIETLKKMGDVAIGDIRERLADGTLSVKQQAALINLCGLIATTAAQQALDHALWLLPELQADTLSSLHNSRYVAPPERRQDYLNLIGQYLAAGVRMVFMIRELGSVDGAELPAQAVMLQLEELRERLLLSFALVFDPEKTIRARTGFLANRKESVANALEILEIALPKELAATFCALYEPTNIREKCRVLAPQFPGRLHFGGIADEILNDRSYIWHRWTKATMLHCLPQCDQMNVKRWSGKYLVSDDRLLQQTAAHIAL